MLSNKENKEQASSIKDSWDKLRQVLVVKYGKNVMKNWIDKLVPRAGDDESVELLAPNSFVRDWVKNYYLSIIQSTWYNVDLEWGRRHIEIIVPIVFDSKEKNAENKGYQEHGDAVDSDCHVFQESKSKAYQWADRKADNTKHDDSTEKYQENDKDSSSQQVKMDGEDQDGNFQGISEGFTFDNFVVASSNELAYNAAFHVAKSKKIVYNPLFIYGDVGLGKTHLMHALGNYLRHNQSGKRPGQKKVIYMTAERFMYEFINALRVKDIMSFKKKFRSFQVLMIDDIQFIAGKDSTQDEFFHTFNTLFENKCQIVISGDRFPTAFVGMEERIKSRLGGGLVVHIQPANYELRLAILHNKLEKINQSNLSNNYPAVVVEPSVMEFLANNVASNIRELEGALNRLLAHHELCRKPINVDLARESISDLLQNQRKTATVDEIKQKVAEHYGIKFTDLSSDRRYRQIVRPRQVAIYLCKKFTNHSLNSLGKKFGGRDHTTMRYAIEVVEKLIVKDNDLSSDIKALSNIFRGGYGK